MVYAVCFLPKEKEPELKEQGVAGKIVLIMPYLVFRK